MCDSELTLLLLVARILADYKQRATTFDVTTVHANLFDGCFYFHGVSVGERFVPFLRTDQAAIGRDRPRAP